MRCDDKMYQNAPAYYTGFWQSYQYFDQYYEDIKRQFQLKEQFSSQGKKYLDKIQTKVQCGGGGVNEACSDITQHRTEKPEPVL